MLLFGWSIADAADKVVDAPDVALRARALREVGWVADFGVAALGARAVDVVQGVAGGRRRSLLPSTGAPKG